MYALQVFRFPLPPRNSWRNRDPLDGNRRIFNYREIDGKSTSVWFDIVSALHHYICDSVRVENVPPRLRIGATKKKQYNIRVLPINI